MVSHNTRRLCSVETTLINDMSLTEIIKKKIKYRYPDFKVNEIKECSKLGEFLKSDMIITIHFIKWYHVYQPLNKEIYLMNVLFNEASLAISLNGKNYKECKMEDLNEVMDNINQVIFDKSFDI